MRNAVPRGSFVSNYYYLQSAKLTKAYANQINNLYLDNPGSRSLGSSWKKKLLVQCQVTLTASNKEENMGMFLKWISQNQCKSRRGQLSFLSLRFEIPRLPATTALNPPWNHSFKCYQERLNSSPFWDW